MQTHLAHVVEARDKVGVQRVERLGHGARGSREAGCEVGARAGREGVRERGGEDARERGGARAGREGGRHEGRRRRRGRGGGVLWVGRGCGGGGGWREWSGHCGGDAMKRADGWPGEFQSGF